MAHLLKTDGYAVAGAPDGLAALRYLAGSPWPDLILLDLRMPGMDGRQVLREQRARPALATIPVALLSSERDLPRLARERSASLAWSAGSR